MIKIKKYNQRGDTIIEVMFAMAIIGIVLAASYTAASKNLQTSELAKERTIASSIAESQLEQLKALDPTRLEAVTGVFCIDLAQVAPVIDANTAGACVENTFYKKIITRSGDNSDQYTILVEWTPPGGNDSNKSEVKLYYKHFNFSLNEAANFSLVEQSEVGGGTGYVLAASIANATGVIEFGIVYGTLPQPEIGDSGVVVVNAPSGSSPSRFQITLSGLTAGQTYYARTFIKDPSTGVPSYGPTITLSAGSGGAGGASSVNTTGSSNVTKTTADISGVATEGNNPINGRGFVYSRTNSEPNVFDSRVNSTQTTNGFSATITGLAPGQNYYVRAFIESGGQPIYDNDTIIVKAVDLIPGPGLVFIGESTDGTSAYYLSNASARWNIANNVANSSVVGHLLTIGNSTENSRIVSLAGGNQVWTGFSDQFTEGVWRWVTNESFSYTNWVSGEPKVDTSRNFAVMNVNGRFTTKEGSKEFRYIVEVDK